MFFLSSIYCLNFIATVEGVGQINHQTAYLLFLKVRTQVLFEYSGNTYIKMNDAQIKLREYGNTTIPCTLSDVRAVGHTGIKHFNECIRSVSPIYRTVLILYVLL